MKDQMDAKNFEVKVCLDTLMQMRECLQDAADYFGNHFEGPVDPCDLYEHEKHAGNIGTIASNLTVLLTEAVGTGDKLYEKAKGKPNDER